MQKKSRNIFMFDVYFSCNVCDSKSFSKIQMSFLHFHNFIHLLAIQKVIDFQALGMRTNKFRLW